MSDVLLAHAFFLKNDAKQIQKMRPYPPLGTLYAASHLGEHGHNVVLFDAMLSEGEHEFEALLIRHRPQVVVFYEDQFNWLNKMCLQHTRDAIGRMTRQARKHNCTVIATGADVSDHPETYFEFGVQYALIGEADHSLCELVDHLESVDWGLNGAPIPGVRAAVSREVVPFAARELERTPDVFPLPAWELVDAERYRRAWTDAHGFFSINMVTTRGCPFHCNWCAKPIWGQRYAMRSPENVAEEMAIVKRTIRPDQIWFADDIFGLQPKWVVEFAREVNSRDAQIPFMMQSRVDLMTEEAVDALASAGCAEVWMGAESGSQQVLDAMDKGIRVEQISEARSRLKNAGIRACFFIQFGFPGETFDDILSTVELVRRLLPDDIGVSVSYPLPGTRFHEMVKSEIGTQDHWEDSSDLAMMFKGAYQTPFYRKLHDLLHRELDVRRAIDARDLTNGDGSRDAFAMLNTLCDEWFALGRMEEEHRHQDPTELQLKELVLAAPDLSKRWN